MEAEEEARRVRQRTEGGYGHGMVDAPQPNMGMEGMGGAQPGAQALRGGAVGRSCLVFSERCLCCVSVPWVERVSVRHARTQSEQAAHPVAVCCIKSAHHACESNAQATRSCC